MRVFIHIGLHKTGTTYLQYNIFPSLKEFHYVQLPPWRILTNNTLTETELSNYKSEILKDWDHQKDLIISNEFFSGEIEKFTKQKTVVILTNLKKLFPDAQIILVLRNPLGYFKSLYNFRVVSRGFCTKSISRYYDQNKKYFLEKFDYEFLLKEVELRFNKANVIKYEQINDNNQYVAFICKALQVPAFSVSNQVKENTSSKNTVNVNSHLLVNTIFLMSLLELFPDGKMKNYLKARYFKFKKSSLIKRLINYIETIKYVSNKQNTLNIDQEKELNVLVKKYDELNFP